MSGAFARALDVKEFVLVMCVVEAALARSRARWDVAMGRRSRSLGQGTDYSISELMIRTRD